MNDALHNSISSARFSQVSETVLLPGREAKTAPLPEDLHPELAEHLQRLGITRLWKHQRQCWEAAGEGRGFIVTTGTASGKSLAFNLPVLDTLLREPLSRALYLYPTKALAQDQMRHLNPLGGGAVQPAIYDGDTPPEARRLARDRSRILLSNPDMLHVGILPHHERWGDFFLNLRWVVVDEAHTYRGVFGSHVANVLRRLRRTADFYGADPSFALTSATIENPEEHATNLTGLPLQAVTEDGAPSGRSKVVLWQPPLVDERLNLRGSAVSEAASLLASLVEAGTRTICFTKSRRQVELIYRAAVAELEDRDSPNADRLAPYRAGYTPEQRRAIEDRLFRGELSAVVATNALELGIDVGDLDASITVGYPGTIAALRQQWGRAGRGTGDSLGVFIAGNDALEQFFIRNPRELLERSVETATTDYANPFIHRNHLAAAAYESPLAAAEDRVFFGDKLEETAEDLSAEGRLRRGEDRLHPGGGMWFITGSRYPAADIGLRSSSPDQFTIVEGDTGDILGTQEAETAFMFLHPGAVYLHAGESYLVEELELEGRVALVRRFHDQYYTRPRKEVETEILSREMTENVGSFRLSLGTVSVATTVVAFQKKQVGNDESLGVQELDLPTQYFLTEGLWFTLPLDLLSVDPEDGTTPDPAELARLPGAVHAVEHALIALLPLRAMCDRWDIGGMSTAYHHQTEMPTVFVYDAHPGGVGIARKGFTQFPDWLEDARKLVGSCACGEGCPSCIQSPKCGNWNEPLDKDLGLHLIRAGAMLDT